MILYQGKDEFRPVINRAKTKIEAQVETLLLTGKNQAGCIFWLKNFGWTDRQEIEVNEISGLTKDQLTDRLKTLLARKVA